MHKKPGLTKALLKSIKMKRNLHRQYLRNPTLESYSLDKTYKSKLNHTLRMARRLYYEKKLEDAE